MSDIFKKLQLVKDWIRQRLLQSFGAEGQSSRGAVVWSGMCRRCGIELGLNVLHCALTKSRFYLRRQKGMESKRRMRTESEERRSGG